jgi:uncharacterized phiE125 gp8 family phage protein
MLLFHEVQSHLKRTVEPVGLPVTLAEVKRALKLDTTTTDDDDEINEWLLSAVEDVENDSQRALMPQTWVLKMDEFPSYEIELRRPPILTVASVVYLDTDGDSTTLSTSLYDTDLTGEPGRILPAEGTCWPSTDCTPNAVTVTFTAGYSGGIPRAAWTAIVLNVRARFNQCEPAEAYWANISRLRWEGGL